MRMKFLRILPEMWASTSWPLGKATRNIVPGNTWVTEPVNSIGSSLATLLPTTAALLNQRFRPGSWRRQSQSAPALASSFWLAITASVNFFLVKAIGCGKQSLLGISMTEQIVILDFGSQYTQVIARRVRECNVYSTILHFNTPAAEIARMNPSGIILSGG